MDNNKHIDNKIKEGFGHLKTTAPKNIWNEISTKINTPDLDLKVDNQIRESFKNESVKTPAFVWDKVNKQLNIDLVWKRTKKILDIKTLVKKWLRVAAVLLLLLLGGWGGYYYLFQQQFTAKNNKSNVAFQHKEEAKQELFSNFKNNTVTNNSTNPTTHQPQVLINSNTVIQFQQTYKLAAVNKGYMGNKNIVYKNNLQAYNSNAAVLNTHSTIAHNVINTFTHTDSTFKLTPKPFVFIPQQLSILIGAKKHFFNDDTILTKIKKHAVEFGLIGVFNNTWIINNETRNGFRKGSLVKVPPTFAGSYGITINYNLNNKNAIATQLYLHATNEQNYNIYYEGKYLNKNIELKYYKVGVQYQRNLWQHNQLFQTNYVCGVGAYAAYLIEKNRSVNNKIVSVSDNYSDFDYGFNATIGMKKTVNRIIIDYGVTGELGIKNIFVGNEKISANFDVSRNRSIGAYFSIRYKL